MPRSRAFCFSLTRRHRFRNSVAVTEPQTQEFIWWTAIVKAACTATFFVCCTGGALAASAQTGMASIYAYSSTRTASGRWSSPGSLTAAHRSLPFGTMVRVTNDRNGRSVVVRITDRGPYVRNRIIDLTSAGARALGFSGLARVTLTVLGKAHRTDTATKTHSREHRLSRTSRKIALGSRAGG